MARFHQIPIGEIFFEGETGEYYVKKSDTISHVYIMDEKQEYLDEDGAPWRCEFPANHQVEDI